jgi:hypothetical protein
MRRSPVSETLLGLNTIGGLTLFLLQVEASFEAIASRRATQPR